MPEDLKERVLEIVSIVKECPENLQLPAEAPEDLVKVIFAARRM
jgi:hypothetical protein